MLKARTPLCAFHYEIIVIQIASVMALCIWPIAYVAKWWGLVSLVYLGIVFGDRVSCIFWTIRLALLAVAEDSEVTVVQISRFWALSMGICADTARVSCVHTIFQYNWMTSSTAMKSKSSEHEESGTCSSFDTESVHVCSMGAIHHQQRKRIQD
jgi:hypothetical protein